MPNNVPPKIKAFNFNMPIVGQDGKSVHPSWQKAINDLKNRAQGPVSTKVPTVSTDPGLPGQVAADLNFVYIFCSDNQWRRVAIALF